ncbi:MAG: hypothetical protein JSS00_05050 [Proteobacteria bacterium]|nr:hypothetical protein [Pseudomonadota bacterium]
MTTQTNYQAMLSKVPAVTLGFWIIKILATTLGETGGDTVTMTWLGETTAEANPNGYLIGTAIFFSILAMLVAIQIAAKRFHPLLYWATIVASTTAGTTLADFCTRSLGIGYIGGSTILLALVLLSLAAWYMSERSIDVATVNTPKVEAFYWTTITFSQTLGTALGDWMAASSSDPAATTGSLGLGYLGGALVFSTALAVVAALYFWTSVSRTGLFWVAFILTRPLGATVGDFLDKPLSHGGLSLSRPVASAVLAIVILLLILVIPQRPGRHPGTPMEGRAAQLR